MSQGTEIERAGAVPEPVWRRIIAQPERAPELIALAAADRFAGPARRWVEIAGVGHDRASLANLAFRKHVRLARVEGAALGLGGIATAAANLAGLGWVQARMVFYIAAAHGYDPAHPMRPAELLALWEVYETPMAAREALEGIGTPMAQALVESRLAKAGDRRLSEKLVRFVGKRVAKRAAGRLVPFLGAPISAVQNGGSTKDLGRRALAYYGGVGHHRRAESAGAAGHEYGHVSDLIPSATLPTLVCPMDQPTLICAKEFVRDLSDGQAVDSVVEVRELSRRQKRNGEPFLKLQLGDVTGAVEAVVWDSVEDVLAIAQPGSAIRVSGRFCADPRYGASVTVRGVRAAAPEEYEPADLVEGPPIPLGQMTADLDALIATVQQAHLRELLHRLLGAGSEVGERWRAAPAAKVYHQAYRHGLLEHSLSVAQGVSAMASTFPGIDRDVAVTGALLHDIGKVEAYEQKGGAIDLSDAGRLEGEIPLGYYRVRRKIEEIEGFPAAAAEAVLHIILSHHGKLEHGSPVTPCTREATLVHMIDNLGGTLGSFDRIEKSLGCGERWSPFDRALSGSAYFGASRGAAASQAA